MRTTTIAAGLAAGLLLTLTACSDSDGKPAAVSGESAAAKTSAPDTEPPEEATEDWIAEPPRTLGQAWAFQGTIAEEAVAGSEAVLSYTQGIKTVVSASEETGAPGYEWAAVELKSCSTKGSFRATTVPWTLSYKDGTRIEPSSTTYDDFPGPGYPAETKLTAGKCVKGKVVFAVPKKHRPATVVYASDSVKIPLEWTVPAK
ncbi:hypothetical protein [Streptomyces tsukubensis]|uniref:hypothetical protein n=1 Tax=Streptomyces tsukubensis TaxID=83656 RepID=UPI00344B251A